MSCPHAKLIHWGLISSKSNSLKYQCLKSHWNAKSHQFKSPKCHHLNYLIQIWVRTSLVAQIVKHLSTMQETWVQSLGWEDPLEKEMAIHSSTIAWKIPWTEEPGSLQSMGLQRVGHNWATSLTYLRLYLSILGHTWSFSVMNLWNSQMNQWTYKHIIFSWNTMWDRQRKALKYLWLILVDVWQKTKNSVKQLSFN